MGAFKLVASLGDTDEDVVPKPKARISHQPSLQKGKVVGEQDHQADNVKGSSPEVESSDEPRYCQSHREDN